MKTFSPSYNKTYLDTTMENMGAMFDYAVNDAGYSCNDFYDRFIASGVAENIEQGNPKYLVGLSGVEIAMIIMERTEPAAKPPKSRIRYSRTPAYWVGWALSYIQWSTKRTFKSLRENHLGPEEMLRIYPTMHEADISKLKAHAENLLADSRTGNKLKKQRAKSNMTQKMLAASSGVSLRMIQLYEQGHRDIGKAEAKSVIALAEALGCDVKEIVSTGSHSY